MFFEFLYNIVTFPIQYFWSQYKKLYENKEIGKAVLLLTSSIFGLISILCLIIGLIYFLFNYCIEFIILAFGIAWLFLFVKKKMETQSNGNIILPEDDELRRQAEQGYTPMLNMFFQTVLGKGPDLGTFSPKGVRDVELTDEKFLIIERVPFYRFRLYKCDATLNYTQEELADYKRVLQATFSRKVELGDFNGYKMEKFRDKYGHWMEPIVVDSINDVGTFLLITLVYASPEYSEYIHKKDIREQIVNGQQTPFTKRWEDK